MRTARVEGSVSGPADARPQDVTLTIVPVAASQAGSFMSSVSAVRTLSSLTPDWKFSYAGVTPGRYILSARLIERPAPAAGAERASALAVLNATTLMWAAVEVTIDGVDRTDVMLTLQPGMTVIGRVQFQAAPASTAPEFSKVRVSLSSVSRTDGGIAFGGGTVTPDAKGQFTFKGVIPGTVHAFAPRWPGRRSKSGRSRRRRPAAAILWTFRSTSARIRTSPALCSRSRDVRQRLSGMLQDAAGRPASAFTIVVFPADRNYWSVTRRIRTARPGQDGRYTLNDLPVGDYRVAAVFDLSPGETSDPSFLETLAGGSVLLTIRPGERKVQDFRIAR